MMTDPAGRTRWSPQVALAENVVGEDLYATLGARTPSQPPLTPATPNPFYHYHRGDLLSPGAPVWVLDQKTETPLMCQWGNGTLLAPNRGMPVWGTMADNTPPEPVQEPWLPKTATPWGAALPFSNPPIFQQSVELDSNGQYNPDVTYFDPTLGGTAPSWDPEPVQIG